MALAVVAMSGGVDSSVVAAMLKKRGHDVIGITMQLYDHGQVLQKKGACCAGQDIYDAKMVADRLSIPHYVFDYESKFKESVIDDFADSYMRGETPLPCVRCNQSVKFVELLQAAKELKADFLATGHYVQRIEKDGRAQLLRGVDFTKDQSYFLFATTHEQLGFLRFPLGGLSKDKTRQMAVEFGLEVADKPDSQDICFVPDGDYRKIVRRVRKGAENPGDIMHIDGFKIGQHSGIINYTIGQRRGLGIAHDHPLYVISIDPDKNIVYVGPENALDCSEFLINQINWLGGQDIKEIDGLEVQVKVRSVGDVMPAKIYAAGEDKMIVRTLQQQKRTAPGQACVIYDGIRVLGGGWIMRRA